MRLSASTIGRPSRFTSSARRRPIGRCTASTTHTTSSGRGASATRPEQHVARDGFVERRRVQAVGARQVEHAQRAAVGARRVRLRGVSTVTPG